ncbi:MAG: preprotein translocase subunit YajC [Betaproteobacteria bacterium RBG_16_64_9]|nr:MAG: preprotein translocase subunit YajC [Betaproteobacteria bacterium RBG_16_64_9]
MLISPAYAQLGAPGGSGIESIILIVGMFVLLYFMMIRPQMKRAKEHKVMTEALQKGDEVIAAGGVIGKITRINDAYVCLEIAPNVEINVQRAAVQMLLPKGTMKSI